MDSLYLACSTLGPVCVEFDVLVAAVFKAENHFQKGWMVFYLAVCVWFGAFSLDLYDQCTPSFTDKVETLNCPQGSRVSCLSLSNYATCPI